MGQNQERRRRGLECSEFGSLEVWWSEGGEGGSNGEGQHKPRKLVLRRMGTVKEDSGDRQAIDVTKKRGRAPSMEEESGAGVRTGRTGTEPSVKKKPNVFVTRRRRGSPIQ